MKIACITDDGKTISQHFGRAQFYAVMTVENGAVTAREMRPKLGHAHFASQEGEAEHGAEHGVQHAAGHGMDASSHDRHVGMAEAIADCEVLLCRGMGQGAYQSMQRVGIRPVVTDIADIDAAVQAYIDGKIVDHTERLH